MTIMSQVIMVDSETKRPFSSSKSDTGHTPESVVKCQAFRKKIGGKFINGWHIVHRSGWTEYQRFYEDNENQ